jgi:TetR/AcrR family fatty acid metabolism transcriptional regulator
MPASTAASRPPRPRSNGDKGQAILRASIRTFARHGFFNAQVADIARAAGVAAGTVYLYFQNKDDLLVSIFDGTMREWIDQGRRALEELADPVSQLDEIARLHLERMGRDRELAIVFQVELRQSVKFMEQFSSTRLREYLGIIRDVIAAGQAQGAFRTGLRPTIASKMFFGMLDELVTNWVLSHRRYPLEAEAPLVVDLFVNGLAPRVNANRVRPTTGRRRPERRGVQR